MSRLLWRLLERFSYRHHWLTTAAAVVGIGAGLNSIMNSGSSQTPNPGNYMYYNPQQQAQVANNWMDSYGNQQNLASQMSGAVSPQLLNLLRSGVGTQNPALSSLPGQLQGAYGNMSSADQLYAQMLGGTGAGALSALPQAGMATYLKSLDPQNALHDRLRQQVLDQSGAGQAARGIQIGGQGQGLSDQAGQNFEMDWSNQLLGRQVQGLTALEKAYGGAGQTGTNLLNASSNMYGTVPGAITGGAGSAYAPNTLQSNYLSTLLQQLGGGVQQFGINPLAQAQNQAIPFLNQGAGAGANALGGANTAYGMNSLNAAYGTQGLMSGLNGLQTSGLGSWLNSMGGGGGNPNANAYSNMAAQSPSAPQSWSMAG